jgi:hypothetical protein
VGRAGGGFGGAEELGEVVVAPSFSWNCLILCSFACHCNKAEEKVI